MSRISIPYLPTTAVPLGEVIKIIDLEAQYQKVQLEDYCAYNALQNVKEKIIELQKWNIDSVRSCGMLQKVFPFADPPKEYLSEKRDMLIKGLCERIIDYMIQNGMICINQESDPSGMFDTITASCLTAMEIMNKPDVFVPNKLSEVNDND